MEDGLGQVDWNSDRRRHAAKRHARIPTDASGARFRFAIAMCVGVVLAYPWYEYWVNSFLLARELDASAREIEVASQQFLEQMEDQTARADILSRRDQQRVRVGKVRVKGVGDGATGPVVIVDLGFASLSESKETICNQARTWLKKDLTNVSLKVQRYRVNQPALDSGVVDCQ